MKSAAITILLWIAFAALIIYTYSGKERVEDKFAWEHRPGVK